MQNSREYIFIFFLNSETVKVWEVRSWEYGLVTLITLFQIK